jgi:DNA modification methylase
MKMIEFSKIYNENCIETMRRMPADFLDMTITSPPYDDLREYNGYHLPIEEISRLLFEKTKPGGVVIWVVGDRTVKGSESLTSFKHAFAFRDAGFRVNDTMIYAKNNPIPSDCGRRYRQCFEYMFCFSKGQPNTFNPITQPVKQAKTFKSFRITKVGRNDLAHNHKPPKSRKLNNIFFYNVGTSSARDKIAFNHPAIFPEQLVEDQIATWTVADDVVYDCFMGSGTTAKIAHLMNRKWIGSEISEEYVRLAEQRLRPYLELKAGAA